MVCPGQCPSARGSNVYVVAGKSVPCVCQIYLDYCVVPVLDLLICVWLFYPLFRVG